MSDPTLKSCPFCGKAAVPWGRGDVCCPSDDDPCGAAFFSIAEWQTRPIEDALRARAEKAEAALAAARAEGAAVERAAVVAWLRGFGSAAPGGQPESINRIVLCSDIAAGAHVRPVESA